MSHEARVGQLGAAIMHQTRVVQGTKNATEKDVHAALKLIDDVRAWVVSRWPDFAERYRP